MISMPLLIFFTDAFDNASATRAMLNDIAADILCCPSSLSLISSRLRCYVPCHGASLADGFHITGFAEKADRFFIYIGIALLIFILPLSLPRVRYFFID